jgi:hypothetical protein
MATDQSNLFLFLLGNADVYIRTCEKGHRFVSSKFERKKKKIVKCRKTMQKLISLYAMETGTARFGRHGQETFWKENALAYCKTDKKNHFFPVRDFSIYEKGVPSGKLNFVVHMYMCTHVYMCICTYVYMYIFEEHSIQLRSIKTTICPGALVIASAREKKIRVWIPPGCILFRKTIFQLCCYILTWCWLFVWFIVGNKAPPPKKICLHLVNIVNHC